MTKSRLIAAWHDGGRVQRRADAGDSDPGGAASADQAEAASTIVLRPDRVLDGRGGTLTGTEVVVRNGRITALTDVGSTDGLVYDLPGTTLLPGLIDTHVHLGWHFDRETDRLHTAGSTDTREDQVLYAAANAWSMLHSGVTTVQSLGGPEDIPMRDAIAAGTLPGPRVITSVRAITAGTGDPDAVRAHVDDMQQPARLSDLSPGHISGRRHPLPAQETTRRRAVGARNPGPRVVHRPPAPKAPPDPPSRLLAIEHGRPSLDRAPLETSRERGLYYDPHIHVHLRQLLHQRERYLGSAHTEEASSRCAPRCRWRWRSSATPSGSRG